MGFICSGKARTTLMVLVSIGLFILATPKDVFAADFDKDGLDDESEIAWHLNMYDADTDGDGYADKLELESGYSPRSDAQKLWADEDFDGDGLSDPLEILFHTKIDAKDTDSDGYLDGQEIINGYSPTDKKSSAKLGQEIIVDLTRQRVHYEVGGQVVWSVPVSTGLASRPTPVGEFVIEKKIPVKRYVGLTYDYKNVYWNLQFKPSYYFHTAYWHNDFGVKPRSSGCVNMREEDAKFLYDHARVGTKVVVVGKTPLNEVSDAANNRLSTAAGLKN